MTGLIIKKSGVWLERDEGKTKIAAPLRCHAIGTRVEDSTKVAELRFTNFDNEKCVELFELSKFLARDRGEVIGRLTNLGYRWPREIKPSDVLEQVMKDLPRRRVSIVPAPGWYEGTFVTPNANYSATDKRESLLIERGAAPYVADFQLGGGSLKKWKKKVAKIATKSSCLRLCISASFAAPLLRPMQMDSFGLNLYGDTSAGKTTCLVVSASVFGFAGDQGLPGWADSPAALEQLAVGYRDCLLPLDETAGAEGREMSLEDKSRLLSFAIARNQPRNLSKKHEGGIKRTRDYRIIALSSSERALSSVAENAGKARLGGEEVRLIDVRAAEDGSIGIFDGAIEPLRGNKVIAAKRMVDRLRKEAVRNQGFAIDAFLKKYVSDPNALKTLRGYMSQFEKKSQAPRATKANGRVRANFALIYAAAALAIDYKILPWRKKATLRAIDKCLRNSFRDSHSVAGPAPLALVRPENVVFKTLERALAECDIVAIQKGQKASTEEAQKREHADGFHCKALIYLKPEAASKILNAQDKKILAAHQILITKRGDTATVAKKVSGIKGRRRYYIIDMAAIERAISVGISA